MLYKIKDIFTENKDEYFQKQAFAHNNVFVFCIASFLVVQQLYYGLIVNSINSTIGKVHIGTSLICILFALVSYNFRKSENIGRKGWHHIWIYAFGFLGFAIAIYRTLFIESGNLFIVPVVYIAVIYGFSFIFYIKPKISGLFYGISSVVLFLLLPRYQLVSLETTQVTDIISNNLIAFMASVINYRRYVRDYNTRVLLANKNRELIRISNIDELTGLYNRRKINETLIEYQDLAEKFEIAYSVIIIDIDYFKRINDNYGHQVGDQILIEFANLIRDNVRKNDIVGRWGGEEFIIVSKDTSLVEAFKIGEKLRQVVFKHKFSDKINITSSFGVASYSQSLSTDRIVSKADQALYLAKSQGRNMVKVYK